MDLSLFMDSSVSKIFVKNYKQALVLFSVLVNWYIYIDLQTTVFQFSDLVFRRY
jgi:hypothetical protein